VVTDSLIDIAADADGVGAEQLQAGAAAVDWVQGNGFEPAAEVLVWMAYIEYLGCGGYQ
jgi:hypothetical protein